MTSSKVDVLISGAGASGLTLAIELARRGVSFQLIEKSDTPFQGSRGKGIQPRTLEIFEDLGMLDRLVATGGPYPPLRSYRADGSHVETPLMDDTAPTPAEPFRQPLMVPQFLTEGVMRERLLELGQRPVYGGELVHLAQDAQGVTARLTDERGEHSVRARYLVGADGGRSFVRHALGIDFPGKTLDVRAIVADVVLSGLDRDAWHRFNETQRAQQVALCPLSGTALFQIQAPVPLEGDIDLSAEGLTAMLAARCGRDDIRVHSVAWASAYRMNARLAERYRSGRVFLVGDAAHVHPPTGGQGLNTSVQDAYNLGWKLAAVIGGASDALLDSYEEERRPIAADMLGLSTHLLGAARRGDLRRGREVHQLDLGYAGASLTLTHVQRAQGLRAGDRAPDAPMCGAAGQVRRLSGLCQGTHWTALGYQAERWRLPPRPGLHVHIVGGGGDILDTDQHFRDAYTPEPGDWILIRPDGYVGAIVGADGIAALEHYLHRCHLIADA